MSQPPQFLKHSSRRISRIVGTVALALAAPALPALAHPGHSILDSSPAHVLSSVDHLEVLAVGGIIAVGMAQLIHRQKPRRLVQACGFAALSTAVLLRGITL